MFKKGIIWLKSSFDVTTDGSSARKLSAWWAIVPIAGFITYKHSTDTNTPTLVTIWLLFGLLCLGLVTFEQITKFKNGNNG